MSAAEARPSRRLELGDDAWRVREAWRAASGWGVAYFLAVSSEAARRDDRRDRRALLETDTRLDDLDDAGLAGLLEGAAGLTSTERRFRDRDGRPWLAQSRGPVWAEGGVAEGLTGIVFTSLEGPFERIEVADGDAGTLEPEGLAGRLEAARTASQEGAREA